MTFRPKKEQSNADTTPPRPPRSAAWGSGSSEGSTRSQQRPISSIGAPKIGTHQVSAWSKVTIATAFFFSLSFGFGALFVFLSVVWLMPPWFGFFRMVQDGILASLFGSGETLTVWAGRWADRSFPHAAGLALLT